MSFTTITLKSWDELRDHSKSGWLYRGQRSTQWGLITSLQRCCDNEKIPARERGVFERKLLREFRRAYHHYSPHVPALTHTLEWLALMQHHGAPTRLLDCTYSVYMAAYFALEDAHREDCVVWAVNGSWARDESVRLMSAVGKKNAPLLKELYVEEHMELIPPFFLDDPVVPCACPQNPFQLNERLRIQKGVFLSPGSIEIPFEDNLKAMRKHDDGANILRVVIPHRLRREALRELFEMNISRTSLFPGLDGYARSLGVYHPDFETPSWSG